MTILTWIVVYPLITGLLAILEPALTGLPMPLRTLILSTIMVPIMVYVAMPVATSRLSGWLNPTFPCTMQCLEQDISILDVAYLRGRGRGRDVDARDVIGSGRLPENRPADPSAVSGTD